MTKLKKTIELAAFDNLELGNSSQTYMQGIINKIIGELQTKKEAVIREKFAEKGFAHLLENLEAKRFKRVVIEKSGDCEKWYADNGTDEGVLIVTFKNIEPKFTSNDDKDICHDCGYVYE